MDTTTEAKPVIKNVFNPTQWRYRLAHWLLGYDSVHIFNARIELHEDGTYTVPGLAKK